MKEASVCRTFHAAPEKFKLVQCNAEYIKTKQVFPYGVVLLLQISDTKEELLEKCRKIRSLGMNTVVFYPPLFYRNGKMDCSKQLELLDILAECGLSGIAELTGQIYNLEFMSDEEFRTEYLVTDPSGLPVSLRPARKAALLYDRHSNFTVKAVNTRIRHIIGDDQPVRALCGAADAMKAIRS